MFAAFAARPLGHAALLAEAYALAKRSANRALMVDVLCAQYMLDLSSIAASRVEMETLHAVTGIARLRWMLDAMAGVPPYPVEDWLFSQLLDTSAMTAAERCMYFAGAGLFGLAIAALQLPPRHRIYLAHDRLLVEQGDGVRGYPLPLANAVRVLIALQSGPRSKASLLAEIWNVHTYHAQVHDNALFTAIARLRASLGDAAAWVTKTTTGYALAAEVEVVDLRGTVVAAVPPTADVPPPELDVRSRAVLALVARGAVQSADVMRGLRVSEATALRVLRALVERGALRRRGTGRATQYELQPASNQESS
ncbi:MAG: hypothetical protein IPL79_13955 [Myxococcales bacterium]|nr:hypothetical protein [Myxococcales bacterium]